MERNENTIKTKSFNRRNRTIRYAPPVRRARGRRSTAACTCEHHTTCAYCTLVSKVAAAAEATRTTQRRPGGRRRRRGRSSESKWSVSGSGTGPRGWRRTARTRPCDTAARMKGNRKMRYISGARGRIQLERKRLSATKVLWDFAFSVHFYKTHVNGNPHLAREEEKCDYFLVIMFGLVRAPWCIGECRTRAVDCTSTCTSAARRCTRDAARGRAATAGDQKPNNRITD